ncbi:MAG: aminodeoxychorismate/anthranilate synthase component II [Pseudomonadota bacterium]
MILLIDNYDSFTYNIVHYLEELGADVEVCRNDALSVADCFEKNPSGLVLSPGPSNPDNAGICLELIAANEQHQVPLLGICLGHQAIGQSFGGEVVRAPSLMHGKTSDIFHDGSGVFGGLPSPYEATRYHSLIVARQTLPACLKVTAWTDDDLIMGFAHESLPIHGVQFHPESIATDHGHALLANFMRLAGLTPKQRGTAAA